MVASMACTFCFRSVKTLSTCITEVRVILRLFGVVLNEIEPDSPPAQPVSGVLKTIGTIKYLKFFDESRILWENKNEGK